MNLGKYHQKNGFATVIVLLGMLLVATALPITTKLVQQNQENRSKASEVQCEDSETKCEGGYKYTCSSYKWKKTTTKCGITTTPTQKPTATPTKKPTVSYFYYYDSSSKICLSTVQYSSISACADKYKTCYTSESDCKSKNSSPTKKPTPTKTPTPKPSCTSKGGTCVGNAKTCTDVNNGTVISGTDCKSPTVCCKVTASSSQTATAPTKTPTPTPKPTFYYYDSSSKSCKSSSDYASQIACEVSRNKCYTSSSACTSASTPTSEPIKTSGSGCDKYNGKWNNGCSRFSYSGCLGDTACEVDSGYYASMHDMKEACEGFCKNKTSSVTSSTCTSNGGTCVGNAKTCTDVNKGTVISGTDCKSPTVCCKVTATSSQVTPAPTKTPTPTPTKTPTPTPKPTVSYFYYYSSSSKSCLSTVQYSSLSACSAKYGICYGSQDSCTNAYSCAMNGGVCRTVCGSNEKNGGDSGSCRPAMCCIPNTTKKIDGICNIEFNSKNLTSRPADSKACTQGSVFWTNPSGLNFEYSWECQGINNGKTAKCSAQKTCSVGSKRCLANTIQTCISNNGSPIWKDGKTCSEGCDSTTFECKAKCKFNGVSVTTDQMVPNNVCSLGVPGNTLVKNGNIWTWTCGGEFYAEVNCSATDNDGSFGNDCQEDKDCGSENKCVDNKCMKSGYCISTKITSTPQIWQGDTCFNKTKYSCTNSGQDFWSFKQTECKYKCQNNKCVDGYICTNNWSEHYNSDNKLVDSTQCGQGCDSTTGRCKGETGSTFKCVKAGILRNEDWSEEYNSQNQKINSTHCYEGGCNQTTGKCATTKDASVKSIQYPVCDSKGGVCFGNAATCRNEGGNVINGTDCKSPTVCCQVVNKTDGVCGTPKNTNGEIPSTDKLCLNGDFLFVSYQNQKYSWQCLGSSNGGKTANCSTTVTNPKTPCDQQPIGAQKCHTPYISLKCTTNGWEPVYCDEYSFGTYCFFTKCERVNTPQKEGDSCFLDNFGEFNCPDDKNLTCLNHKCISVAKAEEIQNSKIQCIGTSYRSETIYDSQTACPSGLSCNRRTGTCEIPEKIAAKKKANDFCNTDAECLSGFCRPTISDANTAQTCTDVTEREYVDISNKNLAIFVGVVSAPYVVAGGAYVLSSAGIVSAVTSLWGTTSAAAATAITNYISNHPNFIENFQKFGNITDGIEIIAGAIACAQDPNSPLCENLREDMATPGMGLADSFIDLVDDCGDLYRIAKTADSATSVAKDLVSAEKTVGTVIGTAEDGSRLISVGGITYIDGSYSYDLFDKYNVKPLFDSNDPGYLDYQNLEDAIRRTNPTTDLNLLSKDQELLQSVTYSNPLNSEPISEILAVDQAYVPLKYQLPSPSSYDSLEEFSMAIQQTMIEKNVTAITTAEILDSDGYKSISDKFKSDNDILGLFSKKYPNNVFVNPTVDTIDYEHIIGHELVHQAQQYGDKTSIGKEYEAYLYEIDIHNQLYGVNFNGSIVNPLIFGIKASSGLKW